MTEAASVDTVCTNLCGFLKESILADEVSVSNETPLSDIGVDSFSLVEIILYIEREYGVVLPEETLTPENLTSVRTLAACLVGQM